MRPAEGPTQPGRRLNRRQRLERILERDGDTCVWCGRKLERLVAPTTEHLVPRIKGGPSWIENEVAACRRCNGQRGHRTLTRWLVECRGRGWEPNRETIVRCLRELERAIEERGGQRRARPYIQSQLRTLERIRE